MKILLSFSTLNNKIEANQKAFISDWRLGHADWTPTGANYSGWSSVLSVDPLARNRNTFVLDKKNPCLRKAAPL